MTYSYNPLASLGLDKSIPLDGSGKIPSDYLPSYVDDVVEYDDLASFPVSGETGKIYVAKDTGYTYRWTGSVYVRIGSGGEVELNLGSQGSPSLYFTGDTNTGIYSPGADQVAISTNGTGRLFVDASGRIGIGTSPSTFLVDAQTSAGNAQIHLKSGGDLAQLLLISTDLAGNSQINFGDGGSNNVGLLRYAHSDNSLQFHVDSAERLRITSAGLVGIGTSSPDGELDVTGTGDANGGVLVVNDAGAIGVEVVSPSPTLLFNETDTTDQNYQLRLSNGALLIQTQNDARTSASTKVTVDSSGRVGIGSSSPQHGLSLLQGNALGWVSGAGNAKQKIEATGTDGLEFYTGATPTLKATLDSSGRLLVGTSSTSSTAGIVIQGSSSSSDGILRLASDNATPANGESLGIVAFSASNHSSSARIVTRRDSGTWTAGTSEPTRLEFSTTADGASSPTERMRITSGGAIRAYSAADTLYVASATGAGTVTNLITGRYGATDTLTGTTSFKVTTNGDVANTNNAYGAISDIKLKENIVDANSQWDDIKALQVRNYNFKEGQTHTQIGLIAQEVELVSPGLVSESPDRDEEGNDLGTVTKSVNYSVLYMKAVKALQEAMERIETLESKVAALESA